MKMDPKEKGLTVGELTMAIGLCLVIALTWFAFKTQSENQKDSLSPIQLTIERIS